MADQQAGLHITHLSTGYRGRSVIENLSLPPLRPGEVHSLLGPNAAGKSTLMRAIAGLQPAQGEVSLNGRSLMGLSLAEHARHITYMPQTLPQGVALTVLETVIGALRASPIGEQTLDTEALALRAIAVLERVGIQGLAMRGLDQLSGGQRQLVSLAQALVREPQVLLLDEPISALDLHHQWRVMQLVHELSRERQMIVLMVLHDLQVAARWSDGVVLLADGKVAASGSATEAITPQVLADVYAVQARIEHCSAGSLQIMVDGIIRK